MKKTKKAKETKKKIILIFTTATIYKDKVEILQLDEEEEAVRSSLISYLHSGTI